MSDDIGIGRRALTLDAVRNKTGLGRSSIYEMIKEGRFPRPLKLTVRKSAWLEQEIDDWLDRKRLERDQIGGQ